MVRRALQNAGDARAADALLAGERKRHPGVQQSIRCALIGLHADDPAALAQFKFEGAVGGVIRWRGGEVFAVQVTLVPAQRTRRAKHVVHETGGTAHIQVLARCGAADGRARIQLLLRRSRLLTNAMRCSERPQ